ncbi:MAG TPA: hypothetical protein VEV64_00165 [Rhizomicrobium sp.]|nr:hypothetical protein [Rhizomicrobium sp.]
MSQELQAVGLWPSPNCQLDDQADDKVLEAVFESMGRACVYRLVSVPHPFGLAPRDRRVAQRWLSRRAWAQRHRDLTTVLALVALGLGAFLAAAFVFLGLYPAV